MKIKCSFFLLLICSVFLLNSCNDDESPQLQFVQEDGSSITLKNANLYLMNSGSFEGDLGDFDYRDYYITDGVYSEGSPFDITSYEGATYFIFVGLAVPSGESFATGNYTIRYDYSTAPAGQNFSYLYVEVANGNEYYESYDNISNSPIKVSGGLNGGNTMTIQYNGTLKYYQFTEGVGWDAGTAFTGKLFYKGTVSDERGPL